MGKVRRLSGAEVRRILERRGFVQVRRKGSHAVMQKRDTSGVVTVPVPDHRELGIGTLRAIIRQSGVARREFEVDSPRRLS